MPEHDHDDRRRGMGVGPSAIGGVLAAVPETLIRGTVKAAEVGAVAMRGLEEEKRLRSAAYDLIEEAVNDYARAGGRAEVEVWKVAAKAQAEKLRSEGERRGLPELDKKCLVEIVARKIHEPYAIAIRRGWGVTMEGGNLGLNVNMGVALAKANEPAAFQTEVERETFLRGVRQSFDLASLINQKMPWRLFCQLNLRATVGEEGRTEAGVSREAMLTTFMSSRAIDNLFRKITPEDEGMEREAALAARDVADTCLVEAMLDEVATGVKTWDLGSATRSGELSPIEKLLNESGLAVEKVATGTNRGYVWKTEGRKARLTDAVVTDPRVAYLDRDGKYWIFDASKDRGKVGERLKRQIVPQMDEIVLRAISENGGGDPNVVREKMRTIYPYLTDEELSAEMLFKTIASVRSIPTLVTHPHRGIEAGSTIEALSKMRLGAQKEASQPGKLNGMIIMGEVNWRLGQYHLTAINDHSIRDGVEGGEILARVGAYFQKKLETVTAELPRENKAGDLITALTFAKDTLEGVKPGFFAAKEADLCLGQVFPPKEKLSDLPGEEVSVAVEVTNLWRQAKEIAAEFKRYRDEKRPGEKTILTSPYFVMEMMIQEIHQDLSGSESIGVLVAEKGMKDLDLHPTKKGLDVLAMEELVRKSKSDGSKRLELDKFLGEYMDQIKKELSVSNMKPIEAVAQVAGPEVRYGINAMSKLVGMREGKGRMAGPELLSVLPASRGVSAEGISMDGPAMDPVQKRGMTISGWVPIQGGGDRIAVVVAIKRNAKYGRNALEANRDTYDFADAVSGRIKGRERVLSSRRTRR